MTATDSLALLGVAIAFGSLAILLATFFLAYRIDDFVRKVAKLELATYVRSAEFQELLKTIVYSRVSAWASLAAQRPPSATE